MNCPICGNKLDENGICPECGGKSYSEPTEVTVGESPSQATAELHEQPSLEFDTPNQTKSKKPAIIAICAVVVVLAAIAAYIGMSGGDKTPELDPAAVVSPAETDDTDSSPSQETQASNIIAGTDEQVLAAKDDVLIAYDEKGYTLTSAEFDYYYWGEYYYFVSYYGASYFDASQPLGDQAFSDEMSWQDYFVENAIQTALQTMSVVFEAENNGYVLSGDYLERYESTIQNLEDYAAEYGYATVDDYLAASYGVASDYESFRTYLYNSFMSSAYTDEVYYGYSYTDQEISEYFDQYAEEYTSYGIEKNEESVVDVRHLLIMPEADEDGESTDEQWQAAEDEINRIYDQWLADGATEDALAALAVEYSEDPGTAYDGGLFTDVTPGQTVEAFDSWIFDPARKVGDCGVVKSDFGYHIIYFVNNQGYYWQIAADSDLKYESIMTWLTETSEAYEFKLYTDGVVLSQPAEITAGYVPADQIVDESSDEDPITE